MGNNRQRGIGMQKGLARTIITGTVLAVSTGVACHYLYKNFNATNATNATNAANAANAAKELKDDKKGIKLESSVKETKKKQPSKCVIISNKISNVEGMDWSELLDEDITLIVAPGVTFLDQPKEEESIGREHQFKVIRCDTLIGMWACVKSLRKDQLIVCPGDIEDGIPEGIDQFVKKIIKVEDGTQLKRAVTN